MIYVPIYLRVACCFRLIKTSKSLLVGGCQSKHRQCALWDFSLTQYTSKYYVPVWTSLIFIFLNWKFKGQKLVNVHFEILRVNSWNLENICHNTLIGIKTFVFSFSKKGCFWMELDISYGIIDLSSLNCLWISFLFLKYNYAHIRLSCDIVMSVQIAARHTHVHIW